MILVYHMKSIYRTIPCIIFLNNRPQPTINHTAIVYRGTTISYRALNKAAEDVAAGLRARFQKGDRAVIYMPNCPQFVMAYYGILKAGGVVVRRTHCIPSVN